ncbi:MAG: ATP-grasp domain-containing protein [Hyphomicrobiaceae bacterium]|nr:ATP-grasp domain-containing protein [Hyphomicrobiaceae bacterium]
MNLNEFQAKRLLARYGIAAPMGHVAQSAAEAEDVARRLGCARYVVKAQIPITNRLDQNAIAFANSPQQVGQQAGRLLGMRIAAGAGVRAMPVTRVYIEEMIERPREYYVAVTLDRASGQVMMLGSREGGQAIESRAASDPGVIHRAFLRLETNRLRADFEGFARQVDAGETAATALAEVYRNLASAFLAFDATQIEINPLAISPAGHVLALDAKIAVDDNAMFRRPELAAMRDDTAASGHDPAELEAQRFQINYLALDGTIGVAVNGAGLALATHDLIVEAGGRPANFMDIRTTASSLDIANGFNILLAHPQTRAVLVNVHGGGMQRCDTIAEGLGIALRRTSRRPPIVIRMAGNNADFARTVLANNGVAYSASDDMDDAARRAVMLSAKEAA